MNHGTSLRHEGDLGMGQEFWAVEILWWDEGRGFWNGAGMKTTVLSFILSWL